ncbi:hypothetical protein [Sorangium sp. So ce388]|uniref:hypothetical protein n=1 Tax=Sorangium sp. So ce388 TaxID=3133309 RepID=UPI003F5BF320
MQPSASVASGPEQHARGSCGVEVDAGELGAGAERPRRSRDTSGGGDWTPVLSAGEHGTVAVHLVGLGHLAGEVRERGPVSRPGQARSGCGSRSPPVSSGPSMPWPARSGPRRSRGHVGRW